MFMARLELTIPDLEASALTTALRELYNWSAHLSYLLTTDIYYKFERGQNCVNAIGTPCLSANIVNTQGVPIGVKAQLSERVSSLTRR